MIINQFAYNNNMTDDLAQTTLNLNAVDTLEKPLTVKQKKFLKVLKNCAGIVSTACGQFKISRQTHYDWLTNLAYKKEVDMINENNLDFAESKLLQHINKGDIASLIFYLKCKGKSRGYVEKQFVESENKTLVVNTSYVPADLFPEPLDDYPNEKTN